MSNKRITILRAQGVTDLEAVKGVYIALMNGIEHGEKMGIHTGVEVEYDGITKPIFYVKRKAK